MPDIKSSPVEACAASICSEYGWKLVNVQKPTRDRSVVTMRAIIIHALFWDSDFSMAEIAATVGISRTAAYHYIRHDLSRWSED